MSQTFHDHFSSFASRYADFRPSYPADLFDYIATLAPRASVVWDCACGNGQATVGLAERFDKVIATDASAQQIASAKPHRKVEFRVAPAEQSGLPDNSIGLVTVAQAVHWFDFPRFYAEVKRILKPGGVVVLWTYGINTVEGKEVSEITDDYYHNVVGPYWPPERRLVEEEYRTIPFPFIELEPPPLHMETRWTLEQLLGYFSTWSATNRYIKVAGNNPLEALDSKLRAAWGDAASPRKIEWPLSMRVGRLN
jgi:ubiquinone/menaquinone biosynthesis C-methylase UbiE